MGRKAPRHARARSSCQVASHRTRPAGLPLLLRADDSEVRALDRLGHSIMLMLCCLSSAPQSTHPRNQGRSRRLLALRLNVASRVHTEAGHLPISTMQAHLQTPKFQHAHSASWRTSGHNTRQL